MGHPDFRINGKIFATLHYPDERWGTVKLPPEQQDEFVRAYPKAFIPVNGAWGRQGSTSVLLAEVTESALEEALLLAARNVGVAKKKTSARAKAAEGSRRRGR